MLVKQIAPEAQERISYQMPTFYLNGNLVHFAAYSQHIGFYPTPGGITSFENELQPYRISKGTARFPLDRPLPLDLIRKIVEFRIRESSGKKG